MIKGAGPSIKSSPVLVAGFSLDPVRPPDFIETLLRNGKLLESDIEFVKNRAELIALRYLLGRALTRHMIENIFPGSMQNFNIIQSESGKPYLLFENKKQSGWLSISHSDQEIVVAVSAINEIGVDIETNRSVCNEAIAHFQKARSCDWLGNNSFSKEDNFLIHWVMYEAYVKAIGCGVTLPFQSVKFSPLFVQEGPIPSLQDNVYEGVPKYIGSFTSCCLAMDGAHDCITQVFRFSERHWLALSEKTSDYITRMNAPRCDFLRVEVDDLLDCQLSGYY